MIANIHFVCHPEGTKGTYTRVRTPSLSSCKEHTQSVRTHGLSSCKEGTQREVAYCITNSMKTKDA